REAWREALFDHFRGSVHKLSEESRGRRERNPLRILDRKDPRDRPVADAAPAIDDFLTPQARDFFAQVIAGLDSAGVQWTRNSRLVRGLDYYRHTAFEFVTDRLGSHGALIAGGRYDGLIETLGGPHTPAVGWAAGIERLAMLIDEPQVEAPVVALIPLGDAAQVKALELLSKLRARGVAADMGYRGNLKKRLARANSFGVRYAIIIGDDEIARGEAQLRDMGTGEQSAVAFDSITEAVRA
ncbi:MAG: His/Gly/Thr/Pro-type tRNA ligase C-terminal domain-containing protein, partial [Sphingomicrobium sp.]